MRVPSRATPLALDLGERVKQALASLVATSFFCGSQGCSQLWVVTSLGQHFLDRVGRDELAEVFILSRSLCGVVPGLRTWIRHRRAIRNLPKCLQETSAGVLATAMLGLDQVLCDRGSLARRHLVQLVEDLIDLGRIDPAVVFLSCPVDLDVRDERALGRGRLVTDVLGEGAESRASYDVWTFWHVNGLTTNGV
jgi:hypothetical protein